MGFERFIEQEFPGAMPAIAFVSRAQDALSRVGLRPDASLPLLVLCPDEITDPLRHEIHRVYGPPFEAASLAGVPSLGRTGTAAAASHVPIVGGRGRLVCFTMAHMAVGPEGEPGWCRRPGRGEPSVACGALVALMGALAAGGTAGGDPAADPQQSWLADRLASGLADLATGDLVGITRRTADVAHETMAGLLAEAIDPLTMDYALVSGIQLHGPHDREYVQATRAIAVVDGRSRDLSIGRRG